MVGVCKTLLFADQLVKISIVNFFPYISGLSVQIQYHNSLFVHYYLLHLTYLMDCIYTAIPFSPLVHSGEQLDILL